MFEVSAEKGDPGALGPQAWPPAEAAEGGQLNGDRERREPARWTGKRCSGKGPVAGVSLERFVEMEPGGGGPKPLFPSKHTAGL